VLIFQELKETANVNIPVAKLIAGLLATADISQIYKMGNMSKGVPVASPQKNIQKISRYCLLNGNEQEALEFETSWNIN
jgi:hypothetical protein